MERLKAALGGDRERGIPPVSIGAYLTACAIGVFVGTVCFLVVRLAVPLGGAPATGLPSMGHLPQMVGGSLFMSALFSIMLVVPVAILAAPVVLPLLIRLKHRGLLSPGMAAAIGAVAGLVVVVVSLLIVAAIDADPALAAVAPLAGALAVPSGAVAGLTYRALLARHMQATT